MLKIIHLKCRSFHNNINLISHLIEQQQHDTLLNNTAIPPTPIKYFGFDTKYTKEIENNGIAILIKTHTTTSSSSLEVPPLHGTQNKNAKWTDDIRGHKHPPKTCIPYADLTNLFNYNMPTYIQADFDANHQDFNHTINKTHDTQLAQLCTIRHLRFLGPGFTFYAPVQNSSRKDPPDLVLGNRATQQFHHHPSPGHPYGSDHPPIILHLSTSSIYVPS